MVGQAGRGVAAVARGFREVGIDPCMADAQVADIAGGQQRAAGHHVVQRLHHPVKGVAVARFGRQQPGQGLVIGVDQVDAVASDDGFIIGGRLAGDRAQRIDIAIVELEGVEVAHHQHALGRVGALPGLQQLGQEHRLGLALGAHAGTGGIVGFIAIERALVDHDRGQRELAAIGKVHHRLQRQRRTVVEQAAGTVRLDPLGVLAVLLDQADLHPRHAGGDLGGLDQEADVDAADVVAFHQIGHVLRVGLAIGHRIGIDAVGQGGQHAQALHFDRTEDVREVQVVADAQRGLVQSLVVGGAGQHWLADGRVIEVIEEALQVVGGDIDLVGLRQRGRARLVMAVALHLRGHFRVQGVAAEGVVQRAGHFQHAAVGGHGQTLGADRAAADGQQFGVGIPARHIGRGAGRQVVRQLDARLAVRARHPGDHGMEHAVVAAGGLRFVDRTGARGVDGQAGNGHAHAFVTLQLVERSGRAGQLGGQHHRGRQRLAAGQHGHRRVGQLGQRRLLRVGAWHVLDHRGLHRDQGAGDDRAGRSAAGVDIDAARGIARVRALAVRGLHEEAGRAHAGDHAAGDHHLAFQRRAFATALDRADRQEHEVVIGNGAGDAERAGEGALDVADVQVEGFIGLAVGIADHLHGDAGAALTLGHGHAAAAGHIVAAGTGAAIAGGIVEAHPAGRGRCRQAHGEGEGAAAAVALGLAEVGRADDHLAAGAADHGRAGAVAWSRGAGGKVAGVVVAVGAAVVGTQHRQGVAHRRCRRAAFEAVGAADADQVDYASRAGATQCRRAADQGNLGIGAGHGDGAAGIGRGQGHAAAAAVGLLDQVIAAGGDAAAQRGGCPAAGAGG